MPDITMCQNKNCSSHNECYRFTAAPNPFRQSYANFKPDENGQCPRFIKEMNKLLTNNKGGYDE